jgi:hypothetical protein
MTVIVASDRPEPPPRLGIFLAGGISNVRDWQHGSRVPA